jgi:phosphatidylserine/phosphatidylglycerophosphate/cardiolipin synthase-like enzyme
MVQIIKSPWEDFLLSLLNQAKSSVYLASPFIKTQTASLIAQNIISKVDFRYINSFKLAHFQNGASDLEALKIFMKENCKQKNVHNLHAKLFVIDDRAIITSGNLTPGGLRNNLEYGVLISDEHVREIKRDYLTIFNNPEYPKITLKVLDKADAILQSIPKEKQVKIKISDKSLFDEIINDENHEEKFEGGTESVLRNLSPWEQDVFVCLTNLSNDVFTLRDVYQFEKHLSKLHPRNQNVQAKIRQQLQQLRDVGLLEFIRPGLYKKLWA